ncbi:ATP-binding protein [Lutibacter sp. B2]|nr:ATP-binding protein [Lutibacter sp. B2]
MYRKANKQILVTYERTRDRMQKELEHRKNQVYTSFPRIKAIDKETGEMGISIAKTILIDPQNYEESLKRLKNKMDHLKQEKAFLLTENNIPLDFLELNYQCKTCKDTGFLGTGKKCNCYKQKLISQAYLMSNLDKVLAKENFNTFNINIFNNVPFQKEDITPYENMQKILEECGFFVNNFDFDSENKNLLFYGTTGLGKTFMCNCIAKELLDRGKIVIYQTAFKILEIIEHHKFNKSKDVEQSYQLLFDCDLLIIDDLGTELTNSFTNSELFYILNTRLIQDKNLIISTNLSPKEVIERYSDRISSRIFDKFEIMKFYGNDLRWER